MPTAQSVELAEGIGAQLEVIPVCGHIAQEEYPREFLAALDGFLDARIARQLSN